MTRILSLFGCFLLGGLVVGGVWYSIQHKNIPQTQIAADTCLLEECVRGLVRYPVSQLPDEKRVKLIELGLEQLRLEGLLASMVVRFGASTQPFAGTWRVEQKQTIELNSVLDKYSIPEPKVSTDDFGASQASSTSAGCVQVLDQIRLLQEKLFSESSDFRSEPDIHRFIQESAVRSRDDLMPAFTVCAKQI